MRESNQFRGRQLKQQGLIAVKIEIHHKEPSGTDPAGSEQLRRQPEIGLVQVEQFDNRDNQANWHQRSSRCNAPRAPVRRGSRERFPEVKDATLPPFFPNPQHQGPCRWASCSSRAREHQCSLVRRSIALNIIFVQSISAMRENQKKETRLTELFLGGDHRHEAAESRRRFWFNCNADKR